MAEVKYESKITTSQEKPEDIFQVLSDFRNIERVKHLIPQDKIQNMEYTQDSIKIKVDGLGQKITIKIVDAEPCKTIKYAAENIPINAFFWIQLKYIEQQNTKIKLTFKGDIPTMFKFMIEKKLQEGLNQAADMIANMPFKQWINQQPNI